MESLDFSANSIIELSVTGPDSKSYILREATGSDSKAYRNALLACTELGPTGKPKSIRNLADVEPMLVSKCLFYVADGKAGKPVPQSVIEGWPARVQKALFEKVKEISDLAEKEDPLEASLKKLLKREGAPCTTEQLVTFIKELPEEVRETDDFKALKGAFEDREGSSKNSLGSTPDGSSAD